MTFCRQAYAIYTKVSLNEGMSRWNVKVYKFWLRLEQMVSRNHKKIIELIIQSI